MPHPVILGPPMLAPDGRNDDFVVLAMGDLNSSAARKNLLGAINIYKRAFPQEIAGTRLILKVQSDESQPGFREAAQAASAGRSDIVFRTGSLSDAEIGQLIASASVFLSPHRSEGYGLTIAEAFLAGVPALATGWSGNLDFMEDLPELLIAHKLAPVRDPGRIYRGTGLSWAEPDVDDAARKLKRLAQSPAMRADLAARGMALVHMQVNAWSREALSSTALGRLVEPA
jgi:glycosyltransferase involved in cell wall biosynthesis